MLRNFFQNKKGASLLEMIIAVALFAAAVVMVAEIFNMALDGQRNALVARNLQENIRYSGEIMAKELRMAVRDTDGKCDNVPNDKVYYQLTTNTSEIYFRNYKEPYNCVKYYLNNGGSVGRLSVQRIDEDGTHEDHITPSNINIKNLKFVITDSPGIQPKVTILMDIEAVGGKTKDQQSMKLQTTISARYY